jgi:methanogenic corrinoid protein MtbC1
MPNSRNAPRHPIRVAARRAALSPELIRAWESRHGVLVPARSASGRRLYTDADVEHLTMLARVLAGGRSIGQVARLPVNELARLIAEDSAARVEQVGGPSPAVVVAEAMDAVRRFDALRLEAVLRLASLRLGVVDLVESVITPFMRGVGDGWHNGTLGVGHEHLATAMVRAIVSSLTRGVQQSNAPRMLVATPAGQLHEVGAMTIAAAAAADGWIVLYLGANTPAQEIAHVARQAECDCVCLSITYPTDDPDLATEFQALRAALPQARIFAGGRATEFYRHALSDIGAEILADTSALRPALETIRLGAA